MADSTADRCTSSLGAVGFGGGVGVFCILGFSRCRDGFPHPLDKSAASDIIFPAPQAAAPLPCQGVCYLRQTWRSSSSPHLLAHTHTHTHTDTHNTSPDHTPFAILLYHTVSEMVFKAVEYAEQDLSGVLNGLSALSLATGPQRRRGGDPAASVAPAHVLVVDGNMREEALLDLARSVDEVRDSRWCGRGAQGSEKDRKGPCCALASLCCVCICRRSVH